MDGRLNKQEMVVDLKLYLRLIQEQENLERELTRMLMHKDVGIIEMLKLINT